ncbi:hypothetical protein ACQP1V_27450 [Microtetraspora malaysiensis]|uniref:hypothetical protein n=1 Tax=Microtetraspora malaysiensis TaxID=161358 RepID=UPI003D946777
MMWGEHQYTLSQFARRAGISEGRARAMWAEKGRLPNPDGSDADGRPLWRASSIDRWCRRTGRAIPEGAIGPASWPDATEPAPLMFSGEVQVRLASWQPPGRVHAMVWDTPHGHLVHVTHYAGEWMENTDAARAAAHVLEPAFWQDAIITIAPTGSFGDSNYEHYTIDGYRLAPKTSTTGPKTRHPMLSFLKAPVDDEEFADPDTVPVEHAGLYDAPEIARVIGRPIPMWLEGSCTPAAVQRMEAFGQEATFTTPDTTTDWPAVRDKFHAARAWGMPENHPQAFAQLARDTLATLANVRQGHAAQRDRGDGWYLVARPARPDWPVDLEQAAHRAAKVPVDLDAAAAELVDLRQQEAEARYPGTTGEALSDAVRTLGSLLYRQRPEVVFTATVRELVTGSGPVVEQWRRTLTPVGEDELERLRSTRRFARLLTSDISPESEAEFGAVAQADQQVAGVWRDPVGRLTVEFTQEEGDDVGPRFATEWPTGQPDGWNEYTVIAADPSSNGAVFALTPTPDGELRADPLPNPGGAPRYSWGYSGTGPTTLYGALARCAFGQWHRLDDQEWIGQPWLSTRADSELWRLISQTEQGASIRLPWPQIQAWVSDDHRRVTALRR